MRERLSDALKDAVRGKDKLRVSTLRLIHAAIKDRDIAARTDGPDAGVSDADILEILAKMIKQRQESVATYEQAGRLELAAQEQAEIEVILEFMPRQLEGEEMEAAVEKAVADIGAGSLKDMGKVMGELKSRYAGQMDFAKAGPLVKKKLGG